MPGLRQIAMIGTRCDFEEWAANFKKSAVYAGFTHGEVILAGAVRFFHACEPDHLRGVELYGMVELGNTKTQGLEDTRAVARVRLLMRDKP